MFVRSALWFWGRRERTGEGWWIDSAARVESRLCFGAPRALLWWPLHVRTCKPYARVYTCTHILLHTLSFPQRRAYACRDIRGTDHHIPACAHSRTRKESKRGNGEGRARIGRRAEGLGTFVLWTALDFAGFSRLRDLVLVGAACGLGIAIRGRWRRL